MWEIRKKNNRYFYVNQELNQISPELYSTGEFINGYARVELREDMQKFIDENNFSVNQYRFMDENGKFTQIFREASKFHYGYAAVKVDENSKWQLLDANGKMSQEYFENIWYPKYDEDIRMPFVVQRK